MSEPGDIKVELQPTEYWDMAALKRHIVRAFENNLAGLAPYEHLPGRVTLAGPMLERVNTLATRSRADNCEFGFVIMFNPEGKKILVPKQDEVQNIQEESNSVKREGILIREQMIVTVTAQATTDGTRRFLLKQAAQLHEAGRQQGDRSFLMHTTAGRILRQNYIHGVGSAHSHHIGMPFSIYDVAYLLANQHHQLAIMIDTADTVNVLLTSHETERLATHDETTATVERWISAISERADSLQPEQYQEITEHEINF
jgi:hypothetical protein